MTVTEKTFRKRAHRVDRTQGDGNGIGAIFGDPRPWRMGVLHDGNLNGGYGTKEAAFESAAAAASLPIREGHEVHVSVPAREEGEAALTQHTKVILTGLAWHSPLRS